MRQKLDMNVQRHNWVPSLPNKRIRGELAEVDDELLSRANRFCGGYQPLNDLIVEDEDLDNNNNNQQQPEIIKEENEPESESESQIIEGDNFLIVNLKAYNTERKRLSSYKEIKSLRKWRETTKPRKMPLRRPSSISCSTCNTYSEICNGCQVEPCQRRTGTSRKKYRLRILSTLETLSNKWAPTSNEYRIIVPTELRQKLLDTLYFVEQAGATSMTAEAKIFWWPNISEK